jgi:glutathione synthase/RimK-type ligase-like ATP-grasp enzyme
MTVIINVLTNHKMEFYSSMALLKEKKLSMNIELMKQYSSEYQIEFKFMNFQEVSFIGVNYKNQIFLYISSEDPDLLYKSYIEDIVMGLKLQGAILIPDLFLFKAHHNKVFMEILRAILLNKIDTGITSQHFGTLEDFEKYKHLVSLPSVIKKASSTGSHGVELLKTRRDLNKIPYRISRSFNIKESFKRILGIWSPFSNYRNKFIIQNFIPGLSGDFKIYIY